MKEIAAKDLMGMAVYSINEGEEFGRIRHLIMDPVAKELLAIAIDRKGWYKDTKIVSAGKIAKIGTDVVTISEKNAVTRAANLPRMVKYMHQPDNILGNRIISENGYSLGKIEEYYLDTANGKISRLDIAAGSRGNLVSGKCSVEGKYILTIGPSAVVLAKDALETLEQIPGALMTNLQDAKNKAEKMAGITFGTSKKISKNLADKINEAKEKRKTEKNRTPEEDHLIDRELQAQLRQITEPTDNRQETAVKSQQFNSETAACFNPDTEILSAADS
ncbi:MAG: PRC-barrel domain-containing protein, partial [Bacillota bacterium]